MSDPFEARLEQLAEAVAFAHDPTTTWPTATNGPREADALLGLEHTAALASGALADSPVLSKHLQERLAAAGLTFCAEVRRTAARETGPRPGPNPTVTPLHPTVTPLHPAGTPLRSAGTPLRSAGTPLRSAGTPATDRPSTQLPATQRPAASFGVRTFLLGLAAGVALWFGLEAVRSNPKLPPTLTEQRASLLGAAGTVRLPWKAGPSPMSGTVAGEVLWSQDQQQGILSFRGLPPLDAEHRFQLWIVDGNRTGAPVDGGVFALADGSAETLVAVQAKLPIGKAAAFVITVEGRDGVVVSKQEHVVAIAGL